MVLPDLPPLLVELGSGFYLGILIRWGSPPNPGTSDPSLPYTGTREFQERGCWGRQKPWLCAPHATSTPVTSIAPSACLTPATSVSLPPSLFLFCQERTTEGQSCSPPASPSPPSCFLYPGRPPNSPNPVPPIVWLSLRFREVKC